MPISWTPVTPAPTTPNDFLRNIFDELVLLEASDPAKRLIVTPVHGNPTIGVGFDLIKGGSLVLETVLKAMGFDPGVFGLASRPKDRASAIADRASEPRTHGGFGGEELTRGRR